MDTYIVRIYRYPEKSDQSYFGLVAFTDGTPRQNVRFDTEPVRIIAGARAHGDIQGEFVRRKRT